jgi:hypothetical protein
LAQFLGAFAKSRKATTSFVMSVCPSVRMEHISSYGKDFDEVLCLSAFRKPVEEIKFSLKFDRNTGTLHGDQYTFFYRISLNSITIRIFSVKCYRENQNTYFIFNKVFFNRAVYEMVKFSHYRP